MVTVRKKELIRVELQAHCPTMSLTEVKVRGHSLVVDEPPYRHGTDVGPTPLETMLAALMSCTHVIAARIAHERGVRLDFKDMSCVGHLDHRGIDKEAGRAIVHGMPTADWKARFHTAATPEQLARMEESMAKNPRPR